MSEWAEPRPQQPWLYPYREDAQSTRLGEPVFRPFVHDSHFDKLAEALAFQGVRLLGL
jgi:hypothetical protein